MKYKCESCFKHVEEINIINGRMSCTNCSHNCVNCGDQYSSDKKHYVEICDNCYETAKKERE